MSETTENTPQLTTGELRDLRVLAQFTAVFCRAHHEGAEASFRGDEFGLIEPTLDKYPLCLECSDFLSYAISRRLRCPVEPKPACRHCSVHCYHPGHREKVREIMRFSGKYLILRGRLDLLWHYFF